MRKLDRLASYRLATACVAMLLLVGCGSDPQQPEEPENPAVGLRLEARSTTSLTGTVGLPVDSLPVVWLTTLDGAPAPGREVRFSVSGGGKIDVAIQRTDTAGLASPGAWTLGTTVKTQTLTARSAGVPDVVFTAVVKAGQPASIEIVHGNAQTAAVGEPVPIPLQVQLADRYGNPVPDLPVTFAVILGNGTVLGDSVMSNSLGLAESGTWTLGGAGAQLVRTTAGGKTALFEAFACEDPCRGRDLLFTREDQLYSLVNGVTTPLLTGAYEAAWSPDGQRIAFESYNYDEDTYDLYLMNADGSNATLRATGFSSPSWSPDGQRLAVTGPGGIYALSAVEDGIAPVLLAANGEAPAWSPDGTKIAFVVYADSSLRVMTADGSVVTTLLHDNWGYVSYPTWSPDGQRLAFTKCDASRCNIFTMSAGGSDLMQVSNVNAGYAPAWSPEGSRIAFSSGSDIVWVPPDGSISTPIPLIPDGNIIVWRP